MRRWPSWLGRTVLLFALAALAGYPVLAQKPPAGGDGYRIGDRLDAAARAPNGYDFDKTTRSMKGTPVSLTPNPSPARGRGERMEPLRDFHVKEGSYRELSWDDLIPPDWLPEKLFEGLFDDADLDALKDYDPRAIEIMDKIREIWDAAPVVDKLNGQRVRIAGFVVPLEGDDRTIREFLLVPYFGACIHVPPPPANQIIHVMPARDIPADWNMAPVWISGTLTVARHDSEMGSAGYRLDAAGVEEYQESAQQRR